MVMRWLVNFSCKKNRQIVKINTWTFFLFKTHCRVWDGNINDNPTKHKYNNEKRFLYYDNIMMSLIRALKNLLVETN